MQDLVNPDISVVVPVYDEEASLGELVDRLIPVLEAHSTNRGIASANYMKNILTQLRLFGTGGILAKRLPWLMDSSQHVAMSSSPWMRIYRTSQRRFPSF